MSDPVATLFLVLKALEAAYPNEDAQARANAAAMVVKKGLASLSTTGAVTFSPQVAALAPRLAPEPAAPVVSGYDFSDRAARAMARADAVRANEAKLSDRLPRTAPGHIDPARVSCGQAEAPDDRRHRVRTPEQTATASHGPDTSRRDANLAQLTADQKKKP